MSLESRKTDITIVLYGFDAIAFGETALTLSNIASEIHRIRILLSGTLKDRAEFEELMKDTGIRQQIDFIHRFDNLGFSGGHNYLLERSFEDGVATCIVLNPDVSMSQRALEDLLDGARKFESHLVGPTLEQLDPTNIGSNTRRTDSLGIRWSKDARHFDIGLGEKWESAPKEARFVSGVTGACMVVQRPVFTKLINETGHFFDDIFVAYREDAELGVRAEAIGIRSVVIPVEGISHVRTQRGFQRTNPLINMLGVRNRFIIRWTLGHRRPGSRLPSLVRDIVVMAAALSIERESLPGLTEALRIRRFCKGMRRDIR